MNVRLISLTNPEFEEGKLLTPEELIVYVGRVSNPDNQMNTETAPNLLRYLIRKKHWSPFEMVDMTMEIKTSRAIAQQILRHRSFSFQEFSQRYAVVTDFEPVELRRQAEKNRQSSSEQIDPMISDTTVIGEHEGKVQTVASVAISNHITASNKLYLELLNSGVAKESARMILPLTTGTTIYMKGSIRSWIHYLQERTSEGTQLEHRRIAFAIQTIFSERFPDITEALNTLNQ